MKGWQEEADPGSERRTWWWLIEGDTDADGYDHTGEPTSLWGILRVSLERGGPGEPDKGEDIDLEGFSLRPIWGEDRKGQNYRHQQGLKENKARGAAPRAGRAIAVFYFCLFFVSFVPLW